MGFVVGDVDGACVVGARVGAGMGERVVVGHAPSLGTRTETLATDAFTLTTSFSSNRNAHVSVQLCTDPGPRRTPTTYTPETGATKCVPLN